MNFLAHIYLSGNDDQVMIGNFIADFVKGKKKDEYPLHIKRGIELHRMIDDFTDHHEITLRSKSRIREGQGKSQRASNFLTLPLCPSCHTGPQGVHGDKTMMRIMKTDELGLLADTIEAVFREVVGHRL